MSKGASRQRRGRIDRFVERRLGSREILMVLEYEEHVIVAEEHTREVIGNFFAKLAAKHRIEVWVGSFRKFRLRHVFFAVSCSRCCPWEVIKLYKRL